MNREVSARAAAWVAIAGVICHAALFGLLHILDPRIDPVLGIISEYVRGAAPGVARATFFAFAAIWGGLAVALGRIGGRNRLVLAGRILFAVAMIGVLIAGLVPAIADPRAEASSSLLGTISGRIGRPALFVGVLLISVGARRIPGWEDTAGILVLIAVLGLLGLVLTLGLLLEAGTGGVGQRVIFVLLYAWAVLVALRILRRGGQPLSG